MGCQFFLSWNSCTKNNLRKRHLPVYCFIRIFSIESCEYKYVSGLKEEAVVSVNLKS